MSKNPDFSRFSFDSVDGPKKRTDVPDETSEQKTDRSFEDSFAGITFGPSEIYRRSERPAPAPEQAKHEPTPESEAEPVSEPESAPAPDNEQSTAPSFRPEPIPAAEPAEHLKPESETKPAPEPTEKTVHAHEKHSGSDTANNGSGPVIRKNKKRAEKAGRGHFVPPEDDNNVPDEKEHHIYILPLIGGIVLAVLIVLGIIAAVMMHRAKNVVQVPDGGHGISIVMTPAETGNKAEDISCSVKLDDSDVEYDLEWTIYPDGTPESEGTILSTAAIFKADCLYSADIYLKVPYDITEENAQDLLVLTGLDTGEAAYESVTGPVYYGDHNLIANTVLVRVYFRTVVSVDLSATLAMPIAGSVPGDAFYTDSITAAVNGTECSYRFRWSIADTDAHDDRAMDENADIALFLPDTLYCEDIFLCLPAGYDTDSLAFSADITTVDGSTPESISEPEIYSTDEDGSTWVLVRVTFRSDDTPLSVSITSETPAYHDSAAGVAAPTVYVGILEVPAEIVWLQPGTFGRYNECPEGTVFEADVTYRADIYFELPEGVTADMLSLYGLYSQSGNLYTGDNSGLSDAGRNNDSSFDNAAVISVFYNFEEVHEHEYVLDESLTVDPTCTQDGQYVYTCTCGDSYSEAIPALGHNYVYSSDRSTAATCAANGANVYVCSRCGDSYSESTAKTSHNYVVSSQTDATCTSGSKTTYTCSVCGDSYTETTGSALGHNYALNSSRSSSATCTSGGSNVYVCSRCGNSYSESTAALGHSYSLSSSQSSSATCTSGGSNVYVCSRCGDSYSESTAALGHNYVVSTSNPASCTSDGYTTYTCTRCGDSYSETISAYGHSFGGYNYDASSHWQTCTNCGATTNVSGHSFSDVIQGDGYSYRTCVVCGYTEQVG